MDDFYNNAQVFEELFRRREVASSLSQLARDLGFKPSFLRDVMTGHRQISPKLALALGFKRVEAPPLYRKVSQ